MTDATVSDTPRAAGRHRRTARLIIMGPQGAGKGTQASRIADHYGVPAISTGDIFRANIREQTELGLLAKQYTDAGNLVPDEVTDAMVADRLASPDAEGGFILDGYPRNAAQVEALDRVLGERAWSLDGVIELTADRDELLERLRKRAEIEGRADDTDEAIARRLDIYTELTAPLTDAYGQRDLLAKVDGIGTIDEVSDRIIASLSTLLS